VAKLCQHCALTSDEARALSPDVDAILEHLERLDLPGDTFRWKNSDGCPHCKHRGTVGQTVVAEMLMPDDDWLVPIREGKDNAAAEVYRSYSNMDLTSPNMDGKTVFEHTLFKAYSGFVDARQCARFDNFNRFVNRFKKMKQK